MTDDREEAFQRIVKEGAFDGLTLPRDKSRFTLPWPISTNNMYFNAGRKRVKSPRYRAWQEEAGWRLKAAKPPQFAGPVTILIELCPPDNRRRDGDNLTKGILDLLVSHGVISDDNRRVVRETVVRWVESSVHSCTVTVEAVQ